MAAHQLTCQLSTNTFTLMTTIAAIIVVIVLLAVDVCVNLSASECPENTEHFTQYQLFMGRNNASGEVVNDSAWNAFLEDVVIPRFPDGLSVIDAEGRWRSDQGMVFEERSKLLIILAPSDVNVMPFLDQISDEYKLRFDQESVLQVTIDACATFP